MRRTPENNVDQQYGRNYMIHHEHVHLKFRLLPMIDRLPATAAIQLQAVPCNISSWTLAISLIILNPSYIIMNTSYINMNPSYIIMNPSYIIMNPS